jgi:hypothetical protein
LVVEAAMRLHNYCIDEHDNIVTSISGMNPEALVSNYEEHLDPLTNDSTSKRKRHAVHEAITRQLQPDGRQRPRYNLICNQDQNRII